MIILVVDFRLGEILVKIKLVETDKFANVSNVKPLNFFTSCPQRY